jgi:hypothetical protein
MRSSSSESLSFASFSRTKASRVSLSSPRPGPPCRAVLDELALDEGDELALERFTTAFEVLDISPRISTKGDRV